MAAKVVEKRAFLIKCVPGRLVMIPSDVLITTITVDTAVGLRWAVSGDAVEGDRVQQSLEQALDSFPELKQPARGYMQWLEYLRTSVFV